MCDTEARKKEQMGSGTVNDGDRKITHRSTDNILMDTTRVRTKEQSGTETANGGFRELIHNEINMPLMNNKGARPKKQMRPENVSCGHWKTARTDIKHPSTQVSRKDEAIHHLSVRLYDVLNRVGASAEFRKIRQDCAISREIIQTISNQLYQSVDSCYIFGSSSEGTTTPAMHSDTDLLFSHDRHPVKNNISDARYGRTLLLIRDKHTQPGYVKLQPLFNGQPSTVLKPDMERKKVESDSEGRICIKHVSILGKNKHIDERNGPADTSTEENIDRVPGYRCSKIPNFSREWIGRKRQYKWPSNHMLHKMATMGCFVVGVGHPTSIDRNIEWRLSFSLQEREMMFSMNVVQHKCYIVLKMIKKDLIEPIVGTSISSYHIKTCMFHTIENTKSNIWKRRNLFQCVLLCLSVLLNWVTNGYCPNYFIKEENMFDRDINRSQRLKLIRQINILLSSGCSFLFSLKLDRIGALLKNKNTRNVEIESKLKETLLEQKLQVLQSVLIFNVDLCVAADQNRSSKHFINIILTNLSQTKSIRDHTEQQTQKPFSYILPFVHLQIAQSIASQAFNTHNVRTRVLMLKESGYHLRKGRLCDLTSSALFKATVGYKLEDYERCIDVLDQLESKLNEKPLLMCRCNRKGNFYTDEHVRQLSTLSVHLILSRVTTCVIFLRSDVSIIPKALQYEMYRSINTPPGSREEPDDKWFDLAAVDAVVYLHFMQYLVNAKLNKTIDKQEAIKKLEYVLQHNKYLPHRETGYNLLGDVYDETNQIHKAIECFLKSWQIRPIHNSVKWHLCIVLYKYSRQRIHSN